MIRRRDRRRPLLSLPVALVLASLLGPGSADAQPDPAPPDSTASQPAALSDSIIPQPAAPDSAATPPEARGSRTGPALAPVGLDRDRIEWGAAVVQGPFDVLGTIGYRRVIRVRYPFEHAIFAELSGGGSGYLTEGAASVGYLLRPTWFFRRESHIRPILEAGPAAHLVVQIADIEGFSETAFHEKGYVKAHAYAGVEALLGAHWGILVRGRFTVPAHRPADYAQVAIFRR